MCRGRDRGSIRGWGNVTGRVRGRGRVGVRGWDRIMCRATGRSMGRARIWVCVVLGVGVEQVRKECR